MLSNRKVRDFIASHCDRYSKLAQQPSDDPVRLEYYDDCISIWSHCYEYFADVNDPHSIFSGLISTLHDYDDQLADCIIQQILEYWMI